MSIKSLSVRQRVTAGELQVDEADLVVWGNHICFILKSTLSYKYYGVWKGNKKVYLHRVLMNCPANEVVDHINGDTTDNRRSNLRVCSNVMNTKNLKKQANGITSKYKGVSYYKKGNNWEVSVGGLYIGRFKSEVEAALAYNESATSYFGKYARLNVIEESALCEIRDKELRQANAINNFLQTTQLNRK
jgi:hypothetical protein